MISTETSTAGQDAAEIQQLLINLHATYPQDFAAFALGTVRHGPPFAPSALGPAPPFPDKLANCDEDDQDRRKADVVKASKTLAIALAACSGSSGRTRPPTRTQVSRACRRQSPLQSDQVAKLPRVDDYQLHRNPRFLACPSARCPGIAKRQTGKISFNLDTAATGINVILALLHHGFRPTDIAVVCFYQAQCEVYRVALRTANQARQGWNFAGLQIKRSTAFKGGKPLLDLQNLGLPDNICAYSDLLLPACWTAWHAQQNWVKLQILEQKGRAVKDFDEFWIWVGMLGRLRQQVQSLQAKNGQLKKNNQYFDEKRTVKYEDNIGCFDEPSLHGIKAGG
ncbi:MAG: hypothetical protein M1826_005716 [Phylliscum demangeonii]|nr:MAG: hypothetical protein M1826_005716 [Phylliscum demangeonii]